MRDRGALAMASGVVAVLLAVLGMMLVIASILVPGTFAAGAAVLVVAGIAFVMAGGLSGAASNPGPRRG